MQLYKSHYTQLGFERAGLFKAIRDKDPCRDVLYPGCSVHITPSLYFPHVVYVDQSDAAAQFFADEKTLLEFVSRNKHYKQSVYLRFIRQDYSQSLPLVEGTLDLLISLFAGGIAKSCARFLKPGGLLLTNNHQSDAWDAVNSGRFRLTATLRFRKGRYAIVEEDLRERNIPAQKRNSNYLRQANVGVEYIENEVYYVLRFTASEG
jgi:hypothetical protein